MFSLYLSGNFERYIIHKNVSWNFDVAQIKVTLIKDMWHCWCTKIQEELDVVIYNINEICREKDEIEDPKMGIKVGQKI